MGKLEDIEARLERLERPYSVPQMMTTLDDAIRQRDDAIHQMAVECEGRHKAEQERGKWHSAALRMEREREEALASVQMLRADSERLFEEKHELTRKLSSVLATVQRELPDVKWDAGDNATAVGEVICSLKNNLRDAEERARTSLRLWQEFGRKLDEKYPERDKGEAPDDYALRLLLRLEVQLATLDRCLRDANADLARMTRERNELLMAKKE